MGKVSGGLHYAGNNIGYGFNRAGHGFLKTIMVIFFIPCTVLNFLMDHKVLTVILAYFISLLVLMKKMVYPKYTFFRMLAYAPKNPNGFLNGRGNSNNVTVILLCALITFVVFFILRALNAIISKIYDGALMKDADVEENATNYRANSRYYKDVMEYGGDLTGEQRKAAAFREKLKRDDEEYAKMMQIKQAAEAK